MRYRSLFAGLAVAAMPLLLAVAAPAAHAATAGGNPPPGIVYNYKPLPTPSFDRTAGPQITYCASGETQVGWYNTAESEVAQWSVSQNQWITPGFGHTILCQKNQHNINGVPYWEWAAVLNGAESNDCVSTDGLAKGNSLRLSGCQAGKSAELFVSVDDTITNHFWIITDASDDCVKHISLGGPLDHDGTATNLADCSTTSWQQYDWSVGAG